MQNLRIELGRTIQMMLKTSDKITASYFMNDESYKPFPFFYSIFFKYRSTLTINFRFNTSYMQKFIGTHHLPLFNKISNFL